MFATGLPQLSMTYFSAASMIISIPSGVAVFAWIATFWTGRPVFRTPLLFMAGFVVLFVIGGVSGVVTAVVPFDWQVTDTYFVVAHLHYVLIGINVFPVIGGIYYWFPKMTGRMMDERLGKTSFWLMFVGAIAGFFPMHIVGLLGMPRRVYTYPGGMGWTAYNVLESIGGYITLLGILMLFGNLVVSYFRGELVGPDPWHGPTLEWSIPSPPPEYNFAVIPTVTSAYPNWDVEDRELDRRRLAEGRGLLDQGHEQVVSTWADGYPAEIVQMPHASPWPILFALVLSAIFTVLVIAKFGVALILCAVLALTLLGWHSQEPQES
jgi:cytochrome c oxidase subunit 1/cytochrome c oxidase subunit I+III